MYSIVVEYTNILYIWGNILVNKFHLTLASALLIVFALIVTSCGKNNANNETDPPNTSKQTTVTTEKPQTKDETDFKTDVQTEQVNDPQTEQNNDPVLSPQTDPQPKPDTQPIPDPHAKLDSFIGYAAEMFNTSFTKMFGANADPASNIRTGSGVQGYLKQSSPFICVYFGTYDVYNGPGRAYSGIMDCGVENIFEGRSAVTKSDIVEMFGAGNVSDGTDENGEKVTTTEYNGYRLSFRLNAVGDGYSEFRIFGP